MRMSNAMPSTIETTRRTFLRSITGSLVLAPLALQAYGRERRASFLVVSDTHLGRNDDSAAAEQWKRTAAEMAKAAGKLILHLGDIVDGGREPQYAIYKQIRDTINKPVHEIPGNHDPRELFEKHIRKPIDTAVDHDWLRILLVGNARVDSHDGFLSAEQLKWIDEQCAETTAQGRYILICMHVPAHANAHPDRGWYVKPAEGQNTLYEIVTRHQRHILALFHGHFHNGIRGWDDHAPVHEILFPSALYNQDRQLEKQQAPGYNLPEFRPGFTQVTIEEGRMSLRYQVTGGSDVVEKSLDQKQLQ
ncbi:MAG: metallophosphatase [Planctomycetaceae bacterium]|nr:metallophosphatase [Planctomycetaceae bacterium]